MNDDELKRLWREQPLALPAELSGTAPLAELRKRMKRFDRTIWWRDLREVAACLVVIAVFGIYFIWIPTALARVGCVLTILSAIFIAWRLLGSKRQAGRETPGASIMDSLRVELSKVETQIRLLRSVWWWYVLPILTGAEVFYFGVNRDATARTVSVISSLLLGWFIDWLNQRAVRRKLVPLKIQLESLLGIPPELRTTMKSNSIKRIFMLTLLIGGGAVFLAGWAARLYAQERPKTDADIIARLDKCVAQQKRAPGIVIGILDDRGAKVFAQGVCENGQSAPVNGDTIFEIGSVTKVFTALLLQEMADSGEVKLDDPISKYLPSTVKTPVRNGREITLADLATQTSGLPRMPDNFDPKNSGNPYADYTVEQLHDFLSRYQLKRDIGDKYEYSNLGVGLLGHVLALRAGTNYEALVMRRICDPLRMSSTRLTLTPELKARLAPGHDAAGSTVENWDFQALAGCGGLRSTANDLLKFLAANIGLTNSALSNAMTAAQRPRHGSGFLRKIGLVWQIETALGTTWHNGGTGGYHSYIGFKKDPRRAVVVLANSANNIDDLGQYLLGDRSDVADFQPPKAHKTAKVDPRIYDNYAGQYNFPIPGLTLTVTRKDSRLFVRLTGQQDIEIFPETETYYFCKVVDAQLTFEKDSTGAVKNVILHQNGLDQTAAKAKN